jgi:hypothetical protein
MPRYATESSVPKPEGMKIGVSPDVEECFSKDFKSIKKKFSNLLKKKIDSDSGKINELSMAVQDFARLDKMEKTGSYY